MRLIEKAERFDEIIQQQHTPLGLALDVFPPSNGKPVRYADVEDAAIWTGIYIASQAFRFSATGEQQAMENLERSLAAIHDLRMITGKEGLIARGFLEGTDPSIFGPEWHRGTGDYEGYVWKGDVSRDQCLGVFFGLGIAHPFIQSSESKDRIVEDIRSLASHIMDNNLRIIDIDGEPTRYGNFSATPLRVDGFSAILALSVIQTAYGITGDEKFSQYYAKRLVEEERYHRIARRWLHFGLRIFRNHINYNMAFLALYILVTFETDAQLKSLYLGLSDSIWRDVRHDLNSFFTFIHHGLRGQSQSGNGAIRDALQSLELFPLPLVNRKVENSKDPSIPKSLIRDRKRRRQARHALPMDRRVPNNFMWKENPRLLDGGFDDGRIFHPVGYLIAYWMGRYYNFISPDA
jgi:hypothetical protein